MTGLFKTKEKDAKQIIMLDPRQLAANRSQPRSEFDEAALSSLAESIRENGVLQPVCVRKRGERYEIISGERRTRAAILAGLTRVPCILMDADDERSAVLALIENIQRKDLSCFEEAVAIERLIYYYGLTQEEAAAKLGKAQSTVANKLRLLRFSDAERGIIIAANLSERQARALVRIEDPAVRLSAIQHVAAKRLNLDQTEKLVAELLSGKPLKRPARKKRAQLNFTPPPRLFMNSFDRLISRMKEYNIPCESFKRSVNGCCEYTIKFDLGENR